MSISPSTQTTDLYRELTPIFRDLFDDESLVLTPELTAAEVPEWDSFNHINLVVAIESQFGVKFQTAELESLQSVGQLVNLLQKKLASARG